MGSEVVDVLGIWREETSWPQRTLRKRVLPGVGWAEMTLRVKVCEL